MGRERVVVATLLAVAFAGSLAACGTKLRVSSKVMCEAHGGTYDAKTAICTPNPANVRTAQQACEYQGGVYDAFEQHCLLEVGR